MASNQEPYPSSLTDKEWELLKAYVPSRKKLRRPARYSYREILDAIFYVVRGGIPWRMLPKEMPPWRICYYYYMVWRKEGVWERINARLVEKTRLDAGKKKPRVLRSSTARVLKYLTTAECEDTMRAKRLWGERGIYSWTPWDWS